MSKIKSSKLALIGYPAKHSYSPLIHNFLLNKYRIPGSYRINEIKPGDLKKGFNELVNSGFSGFNVTMPYKEDILEMLDSIDESVKNTGSVNTVHIKDGKSKGYNTDVPGFIKSLEDRDFIFKGKNALVIGAGGAAKSVLYALVIKNIKKIYLFNRTSERAYKILRKISYAADKKIIVINSLSEIEENYNDLGLIINCTPIGMDVENNIKKMPVPDKWILKNKLLFEMVYNPVETRFIKKGIRDEAVIINGLEMLLNQAVYSFKTWFGFMPDPEGLNLTGKI